MRRAVALGLAALLWSCGPTGQTGPTPTPTDPLIQGTTPTPTTRSVPPESSPRPTAKPPGTVTVERLAPPGTEAGQQQAPKARGQGSAQ